MEEKEWVKELSEILGEEKVIASPSGLCCYAADFFPRTWHLPDCVALPSSHEEVVKIVKFAYKHRIPMIPRGSGTSVTGGPVPIRGGIVISLENMREVLEIDAESRIVVTQPGISWEELNRALKPYGLFYPSTPGSGRVSSVGGNVASGGSGMRTVKYGTVRNYVLGLRVVLPNGEELRVGTRAHKSSCGYDLKDLFIGSEGTLGIFTEITLRTCVLPEAAAVVLFDLPELEKAGEVVWGIFRSGIVPAALELTTARTLELVGEEARGEASLVVELDGTKEAVRAEAERILMLFRELKPRLVEDEGERQKVWGRQAEIYFKLVRLKSSPIAEDLGVPPAKVPFMLRRIHHIFDRYDIPVGVLSHAGDGTIHCVIVLDEREEEKWEKARRAREEVYREVLALGGTITAEHGLGLHRSPFAHLQLDERFFSLSREIKRIFDPHNLMNPGKMRL